MPTPLEASQATFHAPFVSVHIGAVPIDFQSATITQSKQTGSAVISLTLKDDPSGLATDTSGQIIVIEAGWIGATPASQIIGSGIVELDAPTSYFPYRRSIRAHGPSFKLSRPLQKPLRFASDGADPWTDVRIIRAIAEAQGLPGSQIGTLNGLGGAHPLFLQHELALRRGENPQGVVSMLDQIGGYWTYDLPSNPPQFVRTLWNPTPADTPVFAVIEGTSNVRDIRTQRHPEARVASFVVQGFQQRGASWRPYASRQDNTVAASDRLGGSLETDYIETEALADLAVQVGMRERNSEQATVLVDVPGNPLLMPAVTFSVLSPHGGIPITTNALCFEVTHTLTPRSWRTVAQGYLGGAAGSVGTNMHRPAIAIIDLNVSRERVDRGGGTTIYTINADGRSSRDVRGYLETGDLPLSFAWTNNKHATSGNGSAGMPIYYDEFSVAEYGDTTDDETIPKSRPRVFLTLTDRDGNVADAEQLVDSLSTIAGIQERELYGVVGSDGWCTPNAGFVQRTVDFGVTALCVAPITFPEWGWYGCAEGRLVFTKDYLLTWEFVGPEASSRTFLDDAGAPDAVTAVWVHERDSMRITVGTGSGRIWTSPDGGKTWALAYQGTAPISMVTESYENKGQVFWTEAGFLRYSDNLFIAPYFGPNTETTYSGGSAAGFTLSYVDHYVFGSNGLRRVRDGVTVSLPGSTSPEIRAFHGLHDGLWVCDRDGQCWDLPEGSTTGTSRTPVAGSGTVNWVMRDGSMPLECYVARSSGLYKSFSGMRAWDLVASGDFTMIGYGGGSEKGAISGASNVPPPPAPGAPPPPGPSVVASSPATAQFRVTPSLAESFSPDWDLTSFDDTSWSTSAVADTGGAFVPTGSSAIWTTSSPVEDDEEVGFRLRFGLQDREITGAILEIVGEVLVADITINDNVVDAGPTAGGTYDIDPGILVQGGTNLIACRGINSAGTYAYVAFKITVTYGA